LDFNKKVGRVNTGLLVEGFYTNLEDAFLGVPAAPVDGVVVYTRTNAEGGATVSGINLEVNLIPVESEFTFTGGFTVQKSEFEDPEEEFNEKAFFRTPNNYGYATIDWDFIKGFCFSATGNYTGSMLVPFYGVLLSEPELRESDPFFDLGAKVSYQYKLNGASMQVFVGIKNMFNSYQEDIDAGIDRDPGYLYGPSLPRSIYFGIKIGNLL